MRGHSVAEVPALQPRHHLILDVLFPVNVPSDPLLALLHRCAARIPTFTLLKNWLTSVRSNSCEK